MLATAGRSGFSLLQRCASIFSSHRCSSTGEVSSSIRSHVACFLNQRKLQLIDPLNGSVAKAVHQVVGGLTAELYRRMQHWDTFERKWEDKIGQLEPGSKDGAINLAEHRI